VRSPTVGGVLERVVTGGGWRSAIGDEVADQLKRLACFAHEHVNGNGPQRTGSTGSGAEASAANRLRRAKIDGDGDRPGVHPSYG
jgi:hypothetical protein